MEKHFDLSEVMVKDEFPLSKAIERGKITDDIRRRFQDSCDLLEERKAGSPEVSFPDELPITEHIDEIVSLIKSNQVLIVGGETGSGKTTQLPKACLMAGRGLRGMIGHTQPRRLAARTVAQRIANELHVTMGEQVGYAVRFSDRWGQKTLVKLMTDGLLLNEIQNDRFLNAYDTLIIDEAHERTLNVDLLLGYLRNLIKKRPDLKLIVTSATIDLEIFSEYFGNAPIVRIGGRGYPVETRYVPSVEGLEIAFSRVLDEILTEKRRGPRDILAFVSGEREILEWSQWLRRHYRDRFEVLPLYARLPEKEQRRIFETASMQRLVLATNVAETSITVPNIGYVVDQGTARISRYSYRSKLQRLPIEPISQASADQRQGRCGRIAPGICYRLYDKTDYESRSSYTDPELKRTNLASVVLQMRAYNLGDIERFGFIEEPDPGAIRDAIKLLHELGAFDDNKLTQIGRKMARLPIDPRLARSVLAADKERSLREVLIIVSALAVQDPRLRPLNNQKEADIAHEQFRDESSDFLGFVRIWEWSENIRETATRSRWRRSLERNYLSPQRVFEWRALHRQLLLACRRQKMNLNSSSADYASIHRAILAGSLSFVGLKGDRGEYRGVRGLSFRIFPGSALLKKRPKWLVAAEIADTGRTYARCIAQIEARWIETAANHLIKRSYSSPQWDERQGEVIALERSTLYGLSVFERRRVRYGKIDPSQSREIFIREAIVKPSKHLKLEFIDHNQTLIQRIVEMQAKARRADLLVTEDLQAQFYIDRIPLEAVGIHSFDKWHGQASSRETDQLYMTEKDLLNRTDVFLEHEAYPTELELDGIKLQIKYRFAPGEINDGVNLIVPLGLLSHIRQEYLDWLVPGFISKKCEELLRTLPKTHRKNLAPIADKVSELLPLIIGNNLYRQGNLVRVLSELIKTRFEVSISSSDWTPEKLSSFLNMNVQVVGAKGKILAQGRDVEFLKSTLKKTAEQRLERSIRDRFEETAITSFPKQGLEESVLIREGGEESIVYPVLVDKGNSVELKIFSTQENQFENNKRGYSRLALLTDRQSTRFLNREFKKELTMQLHYSSLGTKQMLMDELARNAAWRAFFEDGPLPNNRIGFEALIKKGRGNLVSKFLELLGLTRIILEKRFSVKREIDRLTSKAYIHARNDLLKQLDQLVTPDFLTVIPPEYLGEVPRYLDAMTYRMYHLQGRVTQDVESIQLIANWQERLEILGAKAKSRYAFVRLRFSIEEYRVARFSQGLGTKKKVSERRLEREFLALEKQYGIL